MRKELSVIILFLSGWLHAAADVVEALQLFDQAKSHEQRVEHANDFFKQLYQEQFADTLYIYSAATDADSLREQVWYWAAEYLYDQQRYEQACNYGKLALPLFRKGNNRGGEADCLSILAIINLRLSNYDEAANYAKQCYQLDEASGDADRMSSSLNTLAGIYIAGNRPQDAEQYVLKGIGMARQAGNNERLAILLGMASEVYHAMGSDEQALSYAHQAYELEQQAGREYKSMVRQAQKASALIGLHRYQEAEELLRSLIPFFREVGDRQSLGISCNKMGMTLLCQQRQQEAVPYYREAAAIFVAIGDKSNEMHSRKGLYESLWKTQPDSAKIELDRFNDLKDSLYNSASAESLARYNAEFGIDWLQQENAAERAAKNNAIVMGSIIAVVLLLFAVFIWWKMRRRHRRQTEINQELSQNIEELREKYKELSVRYDNAIHTSGDDDALSRQDLTPADREFLEKTITTINELIIKGQVDAESVASQLNMSLFQFRQRLGNLTDETPQSFIALIRMRRARYLLDNRPELNISEVAMLCAYNDTANFSRAFKKTFGITPTQYVERQKQ